MRRAAILGIALISLLPAAAWSQEPKPVSGHRQATMELIQVMGVEQNAMAGANAMLNVMLEQNSQMEPYRDVLTRWAQKTLSWERMGPRMTDLYMKAFTEPEIRELIAFYKTPTGKKSLQQMPMLMEEGAKIGSDLAQENQAELEAAIQARAKELGQDLGAGGEEDPGSPPIHNR